jgi:transcriptional regulator with XRE-family HTH domain
MTRREMKLEDVRRLLRREADKLGGQSAFAARHGMTRAYVSAVLRGLRPPSGRMCKALRIREVGMRWAKE